MSDLLLYIFGSAFVISLLGFVGIFSLGMHEEKLRKILFVLVSFAAGALMGGTFFHLLPESLDDSSGLSHELILIFALAGFSIFFIIEMFFHWHYCKECNIHPYSYLMLIGDGVHNIIDGMIIAAAYFASIPLGITTTLIIFVHELPQELGIFGVLVHGGIEKKKAIVYSYIAQAMVIVGALLGYFFVNLENVTYMLMPFAAGGFIYIAASDLIPQIHECENEKKVFSIAIFFLGILFMFVIKALGVE